MESRHVQPEGISTAEGVTTALYALAGAMGALHPHTPSPHEWGPRSSSRRWNACRCARQEGNRDSHITNRCKRLTDQPQRITRGCLRIRIASLQNLNGKHQRRHSIFLKQKPCCALLCLALSWRHRLFVKWLTRHNGLLLCESHYSPLCESRNLPSVGPHCEIVTHTIDQHAACRPDGLPRRSTHRHEDRETPGLMGARTSPNYRARLRAWQAR
jgi:hypothetical protein